MPIRRGVEGKKPYYQWGDHGAKYFYKINDVPSREEAYQKALKQAQSAYANGYRSPKFAKFNN